jgi:hypothetical protein
LGRESTWAQRPQAGEERRWPSVDPAAKPMQDGAQLTGGERGWESLEAQVRVETEEQEAVGV